MFVNSANYSIIQKIHVELSTNNSTLVETFRKNIRSRNQKLKNMTMEMPTFYISNNEFVKESGI